MSVGFVISNSMLCVPVTTIKSVSFAFLSPVPTSSALRFVLIQQLRDFFQAFCTNVIVISFDSLFIIVLTCGAPSSCVVSIQNHKCDSY